MRHAMLLEVIGMWEVRGEMEDDKAKREAFRECADTLRMLVDSDREPDLTARHRELLSSARAIAARKGSGTAWDRFDASIAELGISGITARTYRVLPSDEPTAPTGEAK